MGDGGDGSTYLVLSSDSMFFLVESNCTHSEIAKDNWHQTGNRIKLISEPEEKIVVKIEAKHEINDQSDSIQFSVFDYFNSPFENFTITFFDEDLKEYDHYTNSVGVVKVPKHRYVGYMTGMEIYNMIGFSMVDRIHFFWSKICSITLSVNYPKQIFNPAFNYSFVRKTRNFLKLKHGVRAVDGGAVLRKL